MDKVSQRITHRILRRLIKAGSSRGPAGIIGRFYSRTLGYPIQNGLRIIIDNPNEWIQQILLDTGVYEPHIVKIIKSIIRPGDLMFDVGANIGYLTLVTALCGANVHAFEPVPRLGKRIRENLLLNRLEANVSVIDMALSDSIGLSTLYVAKRKDDGSHSLLTGVLAESIDPIKVRTTTLDYYIDAKECGIPTLVKIDVEGCEALVLDGAKDTLSSINPPIFIIETGDRLATQLGESAATVLSRLFLRGYRVFRIPDYQGAFAEITPGHVSSELANYLAICAASPRLQQLDLPRNRDLGDF